MSYATKHKRQLVGSLAALAYCFLGVLAEPSQALVAVPIISQSPGATPFIENVSVDISAGGTLNSVYYIIYPQPGSKTRPFNGSYSGRYLAAQGFMSGTTVNIPVPFLYAGTANKIALVFFFKTASGTRDAGVIFDTITTAPYADPCNVLNTPVLQQNRTATSDLRFDYYLLKHTCSSDFPAILDTDANVRWVGTSKISSQSAIVFDSGLYSSDGASGVIRTEFDGRFTKLADYSGYGVTYTGHHNYDRGRDGIVLDVNTTTQTESVDLEIDGKTGAVLNVWDLGQIISNAMKAGGDDPSTFVFPAGIDWFHNNATTYNADDNTLIVSSRENFVIAVDYDTPADGIKKIHWILGDTTKHWYQYPSLQKFALALAPGTTAPIGQHAVSIDHSGNLMMFDDGQNSSFQQPPGNSRAYSAGRIYNINPATMTATEVYTYAPPDKRSAYCGSFYEGGRGTYLIDYTLQNNGATTELQGIGANQRVIFDLQYPAVNFCGTGWNSIPIEGHINLR